MDLIEDEPRKHPIPVPFYQDSILKPTVPEVSLILQDNFDKPLDKKNDSFSGTEFQTYNAWRWKHLNGNDKSQNVEPKSKNKCSNFQDCCLIKDRYSCSDIEKRKNEILYGHPDEPRRPLPPRPDPMIPKCSDDFFKNDSFDDLPSLDYRNKAHVAPAVINSQERNTSPKESNLQDLRKGLDGSDNLYQIILEQRKQTEVLQNQITQLLKLQEVKDAQIEQLLKSQESKEKKIGQLLQSLDVKDKEIEHLLKLKEKQEEQLQELLKIQEVKQRENLDLIKKLKDMQMKNVCTIGVMTDPVKKIEVCTNTHLECSVRECSNKRNDKVTKEQEKDKEQQGDISCLRDLNETNEFGVKDKSLSLHSADLPVIEENVPTPQSSIHVDIQDFHDSSDESDSDSGTLSINFPTSSESQSSPLGYTFYNNVLTQVKDIIQNSSEKGSDKNAGSMKAMDQGVNQPLKECNYVREEKGTVQSFQAWGVFERENIPPVNEVKANNGTLERLEYESPNAYNKDGYSPSDISLKINALAMKYLKQEQISQYDLQLQMPAPRQPDVTIYNVTNLSFGSMRYMDRYRIFPKVNQQNQEVNMPKNDCSPAQLLRRKKKMSVDENLNSPIGNILDMSALNQQPKLL